MFERVVVALDGSKVAEEALPYAASLAAKFGGTLFLVTAAHPLSELAATATPSTSEAAFSQDVVARIESAGEKATDRQYLAGAQAELEAQGVKVEARVREGKPAEQILKAASELHADVIIITAYGGGGAHTRSGGAVFGGVADEVLRESRVPVLLVRP